ncbi:MAG TPA: maleylpyruvate isomerase family mycothiol-dependent enzyme [Geodermatophilus sp.]|nr:maleylpyruvate isomerase family mycothiol-dependent enzyme [Geodermatophilus sp.]
MDEDAVWAAIDRERLGVAELLGELTPEEWDRPSLCAGWRVRDVAAHLALAHMSAAEAAVAMARAGGSFHRMVRDTARRHAAAPAEQLMAQIRAMAGSRRRAPGISHLEPLLDVLVHGQDIAVPLGRRRPMPVDAAAAAATRVWTMPRPLAAAFKARSRLRGLELVATDTDWSAGEGARVEGPIEALLLLLTGRTAALGRLSGDGVARLTGANPG